MAREPLVPAYGMAPNVGARTRRCSWTVNCLVCHTAEIDGVAYFGAGTKVFDDKWLGEALKTLTSERWRPLLPRDPTDARVAADAQPHPHEPSPRQDRLADTRALDGVCGLARRALHAAARRRDAGRRRGRARRRQDAAAVAHGREDAGRPLVLGRQLPWPRSR